PSGRRSGCPATQGRAEMITPLPVLTALPLGVVLDALIGDPRGWPHPVRAIGWLTGRTEGALRRASAAVGNPPWSESAAGVALAAVVVGVTAGSVAGLLRAAEAIGEPAALAGRALLIWWGLAARSLREEALRAAEAPELETARSE